MEHYNMLSCQINVWKNTIGKKKNIQEKIGNRPN